MIRVLIADDEAPARDKLSRWLGEHQDIDVVAAESDGLAAASAIERLRPQVALLDIQMPGLSGLEVAAQLEADAAPLLVFVTAFDEHAVKAFELNAVDYLLKPYDKDRLAKMLSRIRERLRGPAARPAAVQTARAQSGAADRLLVNVGEHLQLIEATSIEWLEADDNYVQVHTAARTYLLRRTLQDLLAQLGEERFARIHRSVAVNVAEIQTLTPLFKGDHKVVLRRGQTLRMSRRFKEALFARMGR